MRGESEELAEVSQIVELVLHVRRDVEVLQGALVGVEGVDVAVVNGFLATEEGGGGGDGGLVKGDSRGEEDKREESRTRPTAICAGNRPFGLNDIPGEFG